MGTIRTVGRSPRTRTGNPIALVAEVLGNGDPLIIFCEGTRNTTDET